MSSTKPPLASKTAVFAPAPPARAMGENAWILTAVAGGVLLLYSISRIISLQKRVKDLEARPPVDDIVMRGMIRQQVSEMVTDLEQSIRARQAVAARHAAIKPMVAEPPKAIAHVAPEPPKPVVHVAPEPVVRVSPEPAVVVTEPPAVVHVDPEPKVFAAEPPKPEAALPEEEAPNGSAVQDRPKRRTVKKKAAIEIAAA